MKYKILNFTIEVDLMVFTIEDMNYESLHTEILFRIAEAKARSCRLISFNMPVDKDRLLADACRVLKEAKKKGKVQLFAIPSDFERQTTEAKYLINKYPDILNDAPEEEGRIFVHVNII